MFTTTGIGFAILPQSIDRGVIKLHKNSSMYSYSGATFLFNIGPYLHSVKISRRYDVFWNVIISF